MFVDASAIVAILTNEPDAGTLTDILDAASGPVTSGIAVYEAVAAIGRKRKCSVDQAYDDVRVFLGVAGVSIVNISAAETEAAVRAFSRYGKGRGHPAGLNMGDCFAYAAAKTLRIPLLFKGDDFTHTDIPSAVTE
jgi:ribonuclease VapC